MVTRKIAVAAVLAVALLSAGCLSAGPATETAGPDDATPTHTGTESPTTTATTTESQTPVPWHVADDRPDPSKWVRVENHWNESATMHVRVIRNATGSTVHNASYELAPGDERAVYNTAEADPDGVEGFTIVASAGNETDRVQIETSECYGYAHAAIADDGALDVYYAIC